MPLFPSAANSLPDEPGLYAIFLPTAATTTPLPGSRLLSTPASGWRRTSSRSRQHRRREVLSLPINIKDTRQLFSTAPCPFSTAPCPFSTLPRPFSAAPWPFSTPPCPFSTAPRPFSTLPCPFSTAPCPFSTAPRPFSSLPRPFPAAPCPFSTTPRPYNII